MVLLGRFNGQGLGESVQDFVSTHLVLNSDDEVRLQDGNVPVGPGSGSGSGEGSSFPLKKPRHEAIEVKAGSSNICGDVQVLVRTSPGAEYIKVSLRGGEKYVNVVFRMRRSPAETIMCRRTRETHIKPLLGRVRDSFDRALMLHTNLDHVS